MWKLTSMLKMVFLMAAVALLAACAKGNSDGNAALVDNTGKHTTNWVAQHGAIAVSSTSPCRECHGEELTGGISKVSCMSATPINGFGCHATNPAENPTSSFHPEKWISEHRTTATVSTASCTQCHASDLSGGIAKVSCVSAGNNGFRCHFASPSATPAGCKSCHAGPPDSLAPVGNTAPNRQGAHDVHMALNGITCNTCHLGAGSGTADHAKATASGGIAGATVSPLDVSFRAKTFTRFGYDAASGTCSGIVCHGGQTTPNWNSGAITVATDCLKCHEQGTSSQTPQYNSLFSGTAFGATLNLHLLHMQLKVPTTTTPISCTDCHIIATLDPALNPLSKHFIGLTTPAFEATAASTVGVGVTTKITGYVPYAVAVPSGSCTSSCHGNAVKFWINP